MIGLVVVSHSRALAGAAVELALQMGGTQPPTVRVAAGGPDDDLGTDAMAIAAAIDEADSGDGVLVLMDLGSAILSAETAREFVAAPERVRLSPAPFVEGLVAAVVMASGGGDLDSVADEVRGAGAAKQRQLGDAGEPPPPGATGSATRSTPRNPTVPGAVDVSAIPGARSVASGTVDVDVRSFETIVVNPTGLHARPAATFVKAASRFDADVRIADLDAGTEEVSARSLLALMALGIRQGSRVRVSASGPQAAQALKELRALIDDGFGER